MIWHKEELDTEEIKQTMRRYRCDALTATILLRRGVTEPEKALYYLQDDVRFLRNPFAFRQMEAAVERIDAAITAGERMFVVGDRDVDGVTAAVLLCETLRELGGEVSCGVPEGEDDYGLSDVWVERIRESGATLLLTVDCGISNAAEIARASELGIDTVVTDHHNPPERIPECVAVVNPKLEDSGYPFRELSGCGVAFKLGWALRFARTPFYGQTLCLMHVRPVNQAIAVDAVKLHNLEPVDRVSVQIVPGMIGFDASPLREFLAGHEVLVYDREQAARGLERAFGSLPPIETADLSELIAAEFPSLRGMSMLEAMGRSVSARYAEKEPREIDVLASLLVSLVHRREAKALEGALRGLDLVALGTLSDLMPLVDENRILVRQGLRLLDDSGRRGLHELLACKGLLGRRLDSRDVAWRISPLLNAAGRMGQAGVALKLLLAEDAETAVAATESLVELNRMRKDLGDRVWESCTRQAAAFLEQTGGKLAFVSSEDLHRGITGILAARLASYFHCPAMVMAVSPGRAAGSVRTSGEYNLDGFLERFDDVLTSYGGHDYAAGFSADPARVEDIRRRAAEIAPTIELEERPEERIVVDAEIPPEKLTPDLIDVVGRFEPYGEGHPPLRFLTRGLRIESIDLVGRNNGGRHAKLLLSSGGYRWPALYYNAGDLVSRSFEPGDSVDVVYRLGRNYYMSTESIELTIVDMRK